MVLLHKTRSFNRCDLSLSRTMDHPSGHVPGDPCLYWGVLAS